MIDLALLAIISPTAAVDRCHNHTGSWYSGRTVSPEIPAFFFSRVALRGDGSGGGNVGCGVVWWLWWK